MSIPKLEQDVIEEFEFFDSWLEKYEHIIELGKDLPLIPDHLKTGDNQLKDANLMYGYMLNMKKIKLLVLTAMLLYKGYNSAVDQSLRQAISDEILKAESNLSILLA